jgi:hypothetical protein
MLKLLLAAAGFLLFASAAHAQPYLTCEGDSQTAARVEGPPDDQTWCAIVAQKLGWFHVNYAVSGSKIQDVLWRLNHELGAPGTCVVVMIGANDAYVPSTTAQNNASAMAPEWKLPAPVEPRSRCST